MVPQITSLYAPPPSPAAAFKRLPYASPSSLIRFITRFTIRFANVSRCLRRSYHPLLERAIQSQKQSIVLTFAKTSTLRFRTRFAMPLFLLHFALPKGGTVAIMLGEAAAGGLRGYSGAITRFACLVLRKAQGRMVSRFQLSLIQQY